MPGVLFLCDTVNYGSILDQKLYLYYTSKLGRRKNNYVDFLSSFGHRFMECYKHIL